VAQKWALFSTFDKTGISNFASGLAGLGFEILATSGTAEALQNCGLTVTPISKISGLPESMDGRLKTLHGPIFAGILADRANPEHRAVLERVGVGPIEVVVVNFYPFKESSRKALPEARTVEDLDVGGPALARAAARNYQYVTVVVDPVDYPWVLKEFQHYAGNTTLETRRKLARKVFELTAEYDRAIANYLAGL